MKKLLANQFKNGYEVSGMVVSGDSESSQESLYYSLNKEYCYE